MARKKSKMIDEFEKKLSKEDSVIPTENHPIIVGTAGEMTSEDLINFKKLAESHELGVKFVNSLDDTFIGGIDPAIDGGPVTITTTNGDFITVGTGLPVSRKINVGPGIVVTDDSNVNIDVDFNKEKLVQTIEETYHKYKKSKGAPLNFNDIREFANLAADNFIEFLK